MNEVALTGSGGLGAVSFGFSEVIVGVLIVLAIAFLLWKLVKTLMQALKG